MVIGAASGTGGAPPLNPLLRPLAATAAPPSRALLLPAAPPKHAHADSSAPNNHHPASHEHRDSKAIPLSLDSNRPLLTSSNIPNDHVKPHSSSSSLPHQNALNDKLNKMANVKHDDDDFDIDSYYARLHAIPNVSLSKFDTQKAEVEESAFSEIDLNSPVAIESYSTDDPSTRSQSLTSDLAQNFSQLPQVLPQVASTVLNSFSSILNLGRFPSKPAVSNEIDAYSQSFVPDIYTESYSQDGVQAEEQPAIPLFNRDEFSNDRCKIVGSHFENTNSALSNNERFSSNFDPNLQNPQSQELNKNVVEKPPSIGSGNLFRMNIKKKKTYAQVPGLTLGDVESTPAVHGMPPYNSFPQNPPNFNAHSMPVIPPPHSVAPNVEEAYKMPSINTLPPANQMANVFNPNQTVISNGEPSISIETTSRIFDPKTAQRDMSSVNFSSPPFTHVPDVSFNATPFSNVPSDVNSENIFNLNASPSQDLVNTNVPLHLDDRSNVDFGQNIIQADLSSPVEERNTVIESLSSPFSYTHDTWQPKSEIEVVKTDLEVKFLNPTSPPLKSSNLHVENPSVPQFSPINTPMASININQNFQEVADPIVTSSNPQLAGGMPPKLASVGFVQDDKNISSTVPDVTGVQNNNDHIGVIDAPTFFDPTKFANSEIGNANTQHLPTPQVPPVIPPPSQQIPNKTDNKFRMSALNKRLKYYSGPIENSNIPPPIPNASANVIQTHSPSSNQSVESNQVPFDENQSRLTPSNTGSGFGLNVFQNKVNLSKLQNVVTSFFSTSQNTDVKNYEETSNEFDQSQQYNYIPSFSDSDSVQNTPSFFSPSTMEPVNTPPFLQGVETVSTSSDVFSNQFINNSTDNGIKNDTNSFPNSVTASAPHFFNIKNDHSIENSNLDQSHNFLASNDFFSNDPAPLSIDRNQFSTDLPQIPTFYTTNVQQEQQWPNSFVSDQPINQMTTDFMQNTTANESSIYSEQSSNFVTDLKDVHKENSEKVDVQTLNIKLDQTNFNIQNKYKVEDYMIEPSDSLPSENDDHVAKPQFIHGECLPNNDDLPITRNEIIFTNTIDPFEGSMENNTILHAQSEPVLLSSYSSAFVPVKSNTSNIDKELVRQDFDPQSNYISDISKENVFSLKKDVECSVNQPIFFNQDNDKIRMMNPCQYPSMNMGTLGAPFSFYSNMRSQQSSALPCDLSNNLICGESTEKLKINLENEDDTVKADNEIKEIFSNANLDDLGKSEDFFSTDYNILNASLAQKSFVNDIFNNQKSTDTLTNESSSSISSFVVNDNAVSLETAVKPEESNCSQQNILNDKNNYDANSTIQNLEVRHLEESPDTILSHTGNENVAVLDPKENIFTHQTILNDNSRIFDLNDYDKNVTIQNPVSHVEESSNSAFNFALDDNAVNFQTLLKPEENIFTQQSIVNNNDSNNYNENDTMQYHIEESSNSAFHFVSDDNAVNFQTVVKSEENFFTHQSVMPDNSRFSDLNNYNENDKIQNPVSYVEDFSNSVSSFVSEDPIHSETVVKPEERSFSQQSISNDNNTFFDLNNQTIQNLDDSNYIEKSPYSIPHFAASDNAVNFQSAVKSEENMFINQNISNPNTMPFAFNSTKSEIQNVDEIQIKPEYSRDVSSFDVVTNEKSYFDSFAPSKDSSPEFSEKCSLFDQEIKNNFDTSASSLNTLSSFEVPKPESNLNDHKPIDNDPFQNVSNDAFIKNFDESLKLNDNDILNSFNTVEVKNSDLVNSSTSSCVVGSQNQNEKRDDSIPLFNFFSMMKSSDVPETHLANFNDSSDALSDISLRCFIYLNMNLYHISKGFLGATLVRCVTKKINKFDHRCVKNSRFFSIFNTLKMDTPIIETPSPDSETLNIQIFYMISQSKQDQPYKPVQRHWFFQSNFEDASSWKPFSNIDSKSLEDAFNSSKMAADTIVVTDGGRCDVNLSKRERVPVYWRDNPAPVRRCSWFYKGTSDPRFVPYAEDISDLLEEEYRLGVITSTWNRKISLADEEVVMHSPSIIMRFMKATSPDSWSNTPFTPKWTVQRGLSGIAVEEGEPKKCVDHLLFIVHGIGEPRKIIKPTEADLNQVIRRGTDGSEVEEGENKTTDHLLLLVHGIGSVCDLKFRTVEEVVDDFRSISAQLVQSHYKSSCEQGVISRIEVLPISWHWNLHSEESGIDKRIAQITLESVPKFRSFTNDTLLDILLYTSPKFCQTIMETVGTEINRIYTLFKSRNPDFMGGVSLGGHSLGSLILFDLLSHQIPPEKMENQGETHVKGAAGTGQLSLVYPQLVFKPMAFFALGSPIGMFVCVRGIEELGENFEFPTCPSFFNIFHPFDPVAYRIESLINPELTKLHPVQIAHHKGRKRMHLELKDTVTRVGADIRQKIVDSMKSTWDTFYQLRAKEEAETERTIDEPEKPMTEAETSLLKHLGKLNGGRRVDYVLQEAPFELFNEYIFAMASHVCYWESEDTMLLILKEIYSNLGVETDRQLPQQTMTIERPVASNLPSISKSP
ncbi:uncharacterized protein LOC143915940 [Arctopsyche grandis]|uniref:uncharacterized protein LOC143915940 n=1 Tax=Arctopsyche grandis TaxID=121162 RepID=UPI00406D7B08